MTLTHADAALMSHHLRRVESLRVQAANEQRRASRSYHADTWIRRWRGGPSPRTRYTRARNLTDAWLEADRAYRDFLRTRSHA